jgi:hypothetical protein
MTVERRMTDVVTVRDDHGSHVRVTARTLVNSTVAPRGHPMCVRTARASGHGTVTAGNNPNFM